MSEQAKWEYRLVTAPWTAPGESWAEFYLNPAGDEGWEAISVLPAGDEVHILLKRSKASTVRARSAGF